MGAETGLSRRRSRVGVPSLPLPAARTCRARGPPCGTLSCLKQSQRVAERSTVSLLNVFEPADRRETVQGWALHATRRRIIHEGEARRLDQLHNWVGVLSASLAAVAGTSAFAAWQTGSKSLAAAIATAVVGIGAAVLGNVVTFLNFGARAESHRNAAAAYKNVLREFEEACGNSRDTKNELGPETLATLKQLLGAADESAPTVPTRRGEQVEQRPFRFVRKAEDLSRSP
jgi:hypothetical protein